MTKFDHFRMELDADILEYYGRGREESRLRQGVGRLEFWRTQDILRRVLPSRAAACSTWAADAGSMRRGWRPAGGMCF